MTDTRDRTRVCATSVARVRVGDTHPGRLMDSLKSGKFGKSATAYAGGL